MIIFRDFGNLKSNYVISSVKNINKSKNYIELEYNNKKMILKIVPWNFYYIKSPFDKNNEITFNNVFKNFFGINDGDEIKIKFLEENTFNKIFFQKIELDDNQLYDDDYLEDCFINKHYEFYDFKNDKKVTIQNNIQGLVKHKFYKNKMKNLENFILS
jgi:D-hexose-6-phosphate mutarotase